MQRLLPPVLFVGLALAAMLLYLLAAGPELVGSPARWIGVPLAVGGLGVSVAGARQFDSVGTNIQTFGQPDVLVADGIFAWTRNPMYLGFSLALVGWAIGLGTATAWIAPLSFIFAADRWYIPFEEARMEETFGSEYETYRQQVRRWIGRR